VPAHPVARDILRAFGGPVVAPSANFIGHVSPTTAAHVQSDLMGRIDLIVDAGAVNVGVESTIVGCFDQPMLLRPGGVPRGQIERVLGRALMQPPEDPTAIAGSRWRRAFWPRITHRGTPLRLNADRIEAGEALWPSVRARCREWMPRIRHEFVRARATLTEAAAIFWLPSRARCQARGAIAVMSVPRTDLGEAINDRLCAGHCRQSNADAEPIIDRPPNPSGERTSPQWRARAWHRAREGNQKDWHGFGEVAARDNSWRMSRHPFPGTSRGPKASQRLAGLDAVGVERQRVRGA